jgi:hypothetical protein
VHAAFQLLRNVVIFATIRAHIEAACTSVATTAANKPPSRAQSFVARMKNQDQVVSSSVTILQYYPIGSVEN